MKNVDVYVRVGNEDWKIAKQLKRPVGRDVYIRVNMHADTIRVVQKTAVMNRLKFIDDFEVYAQKK